MGKTFTPPFRIEVDYKKVLRVLGRRIEVDYEWAEHWGKPPPGIKTVYVVKDRDHTIVSTSRTRQRAEASLLAMQTLYGSTRSVPCHDSQPHSMNNPPS